MPWERQEAHHVGAYAFVWFSDGEGAWLIAIWGVEDVPREPALSDVAAALTVHHVRARENLGRRRRVVRDICERFMSDIPFRVRLIRNKVPTIRRLRAEGVLPEDA